MKSKEYREIIAMEFLNSLKENPREWKQNWSAGQTGWPSNAATNKRYNGINMLHLKHAELKKGYPDNRWCTFKQIQDKGWKLKKGSHGEKVEYWMPYDREERKFISWEAARKLNDAARITAYPKLYTVFNASMIEGIPEKNIEASHNTINPDILIEKISSNMAVEILNDGGTRAYYRPDEDKIHLPPQECFDDDYAYNSTALHELGHATGHSSRINRNMAGDYSSDDYAYEELVAEMTSCFMSEHLAARMSDEHFENHKAYIQSWGRMIGKNPEIFIHAVKDAQKAASYLELKGGIISEKEYQQKEHGTFTIPKTQAKETAPSMTAQMVSREAQPKFSPGRLREKPKTGGKKQTVKEISM